MDSTTKPSNVANLTLERVRCLESGFERLKEVVSVQNEKMDALLDLAAGTRADFSGFMKLYAAQDGRLSHIEKDIARIKVRLDLSDTPNPD